MDHIDKDEELVCPLCGGQVLWMPVSHIYVCEHCKQSYSEMNGVYLRKERKATAEKPSAGGDAAKLREALTDFVAAYEEDSDIDIEMMSKAYEKAKSALSAPPRNREVGTPKEQEDRFCQMCDARTDSTGIAGVDCSDPETSCLLCALKWAQMPYEADAQKGGAE